MIPAAGHSGRRFLFRSFLFLVGGLIAVAFVLDFGLRRLTPEDPVSRELAQALLHNIETQLAGLPDSERAAALAGLSAQYSFTIELLPADSVAGAASEPGLVEMADNDNEITYLAWSAPLAAHVRIGPLGTATGSVLADWIPRLFYLAVFLIVAAWLWPLMRDLNLITRAARAFASDYRQPMQTAGQATALRELATNLDDMAAQIHTLIGNQKELTSALSHEMRTPLARMRMALAVMRDQQPVAELEQIEQDVTEIDHLVAALLDYARLDHPGLELQWQQVPADGWLEEYVSKARELGAQLSVSNALGAETIRVDPQLMGLALSNLVVNAARYSNSQVEVTLQRTPQGVEIVVDDDGPGIPAAERENVFNAFRRLDQSRSKHTGGYGLGLAIVRRIARLHGGDVAISDSPLGGARMLLQWRVDEDDETKT